MPLARHDVAGITNKKTIHNFYSHASCEAWPWPPYLVTGAFVFLLTCLLRGMTKASVTACLRLTFLLTCLLRGMTAAGGSQETNDDISTHMPLARHDYRHIAVVEHSRNFYSHASCEAWRNEYGRLPASGNFYSHASCEAWPNNNRLANISIYFYSHASCEAWQDLVGWVLICLYFYSHASCEAWPTPIFVPFLHEKFLLTCLLRGMTYGVGNYTGV